MAWTTTDYFPQRGDIGERPADNKDSVGGEQVNEKYWDYLWDKADKLEANVYDVLTDIDADQDGIVDKADSGATGFTFDAGATLNDVLNMNGNNISNVNSIFGSGSTISFQNSDFNIVDGDLIVDNDIVDAAANTVYDQVNNWVPQARLENDSLTVTAGDGLKSGGLVSLGGSTTLNIEPNDFAGSGLQDDGADNLELINDSITVTAGDGLKNGGLVSLGGSTTINIEPTDFAGTNLSDDGADNLQLDISTAVQFNQNEAQSLVLENIAGDATTPVVGQVWYDTTQD